MENWKAIAVIPITLVMLALLLWVAYQSKPVPTIAPTPAPDFAAIKDVKVKKDKFFSYMLPFVRKANSEIRDERAELLRIVAKLNSNIAPTEQEQETIKVLAKKYRVTKVDPFSSEALQRLERRIDTIPASLALAQAANESGWGTARFAKLGNNFYGLWCWSKSCGIVPKERSEGEVHEVARFQSPLGSVKYYMLTLNSHPAYKELRQLRSEARTNNESLTGLLLAEGLLSYSERRGAYVEEIQAMIQVNGLRRFNLSNPDLDSS